ncbi:MAG: hypothetical protein H0T55_10670 [Rubrobacteraceae bacterium]|nr:hypothetical protein [Rubrobacteraceae bacterium]MBA3585629.1 hypothetical protein [Gemmatimonadota bacterium]MDQ3251002.1 DUF6022 family protein [Actinomycetota bacterium]MDQ3499013.1 DUF6022 family protein [Actinomycetota bacterium]
MKPLEEVLSAQDKRTIEVLADYVQDHVRERWRQVLEEGQEELLRLYDEAGAPAYGIFARKLFRPVQEQLELAGFLSEPRFPGSLSASREWARARSGNAGCGAWLDGVKGCRWGRSSWASSTTTPGFAFLVLPVFSPWRRRTSTP